jgi:two-component system chemotaxis response regulator CheB
MTQAVTGHPGSVTGAIAIGGSAGSLQIICDIVHCLYSPYPLPVIVCLHITPYPALELPVFLQRYTTLQVKEAEDKEVIAPNCIYTAPAGYHLLVEPGGLFSLSVDDPVAFARPSIDVLFEAAADAYRHQLTAILLSGASYDGASGLKHVCKLGGCVIVQKPDTAQHSIMPNAGLKAVTEACVLTPEEIMQYMCGNRQGIPDSLS